MNPETCFEELIFYNLVSCLCELIAFCVLTSLFISYMGFPAYLDN